jgi:hypothetical protein
MQALISCVNRDKIWHIVESHDLDSIEPDQWYPVTWWLEVFDSISEERATMTPNLVAIGMEYVQTAIWPAEVTTIEDALMAVNDTYQVNHDGGYVGEFSIIAMGPGKVEVLDNTPYPPDFVYGMLYQLVQQHAPLGRRPIVERQPAHDEVQSYLITW